MIERTPSRTAAAARSGSSANQVIPASSSRGTSSGRRCASAQAYGVEGWKRCTLPTAATGAIADSGELWKAIRRSTAERSARPGACASWPWIIVSSTSTTTVSASCGVATWASSRAVCARSRVVPILAEAELISASRSCAALASRSACARARTVSCWRW